MSFFSIVDSPTLGRAVYRAGRAADDGVRGTEPRKRRPLPGKLRDLTLDERAAGVARVKALFGGRVPVLAPGQDAPRS